jgi:drug/metabolite transporter (DMT)-like permease
MGETLRVPVADAPDLLRMPPPADLATIAVALVAVSTSGPLMAATAAPALCIAFWRNAIASGLIVPYAMVRNRAELRGMGRAETRMALVAGGFLAAHFATWVPSLTYTSVASATALVSTQPIWAALLARRGGHHVPRQAWVGIVLAVVGAGLLSGADFTVSSRALAGDVLAVAGGMFAAGYTVAGHRVRQSVSTSSYTAICYSAAALVLLVVCLAAQKPLTGYSANTWVKLVAITLGAQLLGHSLFNRVLRTTSPTVVSLAILFEVPGATLLAWVWLGQHPAPSAVPGLLLLLVGIGVVIAARDRSTPAAVPVE